jgi:ABC-2 type transport system ATP-binding protein
VLIVDEPTAGLDPEERVRFRNLLSEIAEERIVILSTHIVGDIEATCENIAILDNGEILYKGSVATLVEAAQGKIYSAQISKMELPQMKEQYPITSMVAMGNLVNIRFAADQNPFETAKLCEANVEDAYMYLMQEKRGEK